ncbi:hypothetical protein BKA65DRAFT_576952 [Rhexocercosporidium sp. MPI-PUGE-AT-0058]|nr:hypothetical protein BKA65DRAFT_576952 [Rhexocercosporidium sp. MPI-PUGE-AT-0058]
MAVPISATVQDFIDTEAAYANIAAQATGQDGRSTVEYLLREVRAAHQIINRRQNDISRLNEQLKAANDRAATAERAVVRNAWISSTENARLRAENTRLNELIAAGNKDAEASTGKASCTSGIHCISEQNLKELLDFANQYTDTAPTLYSNLQQLIHRLADCQQDTSASGQTCGGLEARSSGSDCEIDFNDYIRLFDETVANAHILRTRIAFLEGNVGTGSPRHFDASIQHRDDIGTVTLQLNKATIKIAHLNTENERLKEQIRTFNADSTVLTAQLAFAEGRVATLLSEQITVAEAKAEQTRLGALLEDCTRQKEVLSQTSGNNAVSRPGVDIAEIAQRANRVLGLEAELKDAGKVVDDLQERIRGNRAAADQVETDLLNQRVEELTQDLNTAEQAQGEAEADLAEERVTVETLTWQLTGLNRQIADLTEQRTAAENARDDAQVETNNQLSEVDRLQALLDICDEGGSQSVPAVAAPARRAETAKLKKQVKDLTKARDTLQAQVDAIEQDPELAATIQGLQIQVDDLNRDLKKAQRSQKRAENKATKAEAEVTRLSNVLDTREATINRIRGERTAARADRDDLRIRVQVAEESVGADGVAIQRKLEDAISAARQAQVVQINLTALNREITIERDQLRAQAADLEARIADLEARLAVARQARGRGADDDCEEEKAALRETITDLQQVVMRTRKALDANRQASNDAQDENNRQVGQLKAELKDARDNIENLQNQLNAAQAGGSEPESERNATLVGRLRNAATQISRLQQAVTDMDNQITAALSNAEVAELRTQLAVAQTDIQRLTLNLAPDQAELQQLRAEVERLNGLLQDSDVTKRRLEAAEADVTLLQALHDQNHGHQTGDDILDDCPEVLRKYQEAEIVRLQAQLDAVPQVLQLQRRVEQLNREIGQQMTDLGAAHHKITALTTQLQSGSPETDTDLRKRINECNNQVAAKDAQIRELQSELASQQLQLECCQASKKTLLDTIATLETAVTKLEIRLNDCLEENPCRGDEALIRALEEVGRNQNIRENERRLLADKSQALREQLKDAEAAVSDLTKQNEKLRKESKHCIVQMSAKICGPGIKHAKLVAEFNRLLEIAGYLHEELEAVKELINTVSPAEVKEPKNLFYGLSRHTNEIQERLQNLVKAAVSRLDDETNLKAANASLREQNQRLQRELQGSLDNNNIEERQQVIPSLELQVETLSNMLALATDNHNPDLPKQDYLSTAEKNAYIIDIETWQQRVKELDQEIEELKQQIDDLKKENTKLILDLNNAKIELFDKISGAVDHLREEEIAKEREAEEYESDGSEDVSEETITERTLVAAEPGTPEEEAHQREDFQTRLTRSGIRTNPSVAGDTPVPIREKRKRKSSKHADTSTEVLEESVQPQRRSTRLSKRKSTSSETNPKQSKPASKKRRTV